MARTAGQKWYFPSNTKARRREARRRGLDPADLDGLAQLEREERARNRGPRSEAALPCFSGPLGNSAAASVAEGLLCVTDFYPRPDFFVMAAMDRSGLVAAAE